MLALLRSNATETRRGRTRRRPGRPSGASHRPRTYTHGSWLWVPGLASLRSPAGDDGVEEANLFLEPLKGGSNDLSKTGSGWKIRKLGGVDPARFAEFLIERRLAGLPARGEAQDHKMSLHPALRIVVYGFAETGKGDRLDCQACLLG